MCVSETHGVDHQQIARMKGVKKIASGSLFSAAQARGYLRYSCQNVHFSISLYHSASGQCMGHYFLKGHLQAGSSQTILIIPSPLISEFL